MGITLAWYLAGLVIVMGYTSLNAIFRVGLFPIHIRALGIGFPFAVEASLFGSTAEGPKDNLIH